MAPQAEFFPRSAARRCAVRLLFLAWILYFFAGLVIRKKYGEPYPALLMPSFAGPGLSNMTRTEGETDIVHMTVTFTDETTAEISPKRLSGGGYPATLMVQMFRKPAGTKSTVTHGFRPITPDVKRYLYARLRSLFPHKAPTSILFQVYRERVQLDHPATIKDLDVVAQRTVSFTDENAD